MSGPHDNLPEADSLCVPEVGLHRRALPASWPEGRREVARVRVTVGGEAHGVGVPGGGAPARTRATRRSEHSAGLQRVATLGRFTRTSVSL